MKRYYEFYCPVKIIAGHQALDNIPFELSLLGVRRAMVITDAGVRQNGLLEPIETAFALTDMDLAGVFDQVPHDSSLEVVRQIAHEFRVADADAILAVGGGSVIDTAKAVNILVSEGGDDLSAYVGAHHLPKPLKPLFVIPTTAGTGSEVTMVAVVADSQNAQKMLFASYYLLPTAAILDPRMTQTLPPRLTAMTAMDALTHAIEAYTGLGHNPISDAYACSAIELIAKHLFWVLDNPTEADGRLALAQASTMAGMAFSNSMVALVHSLGHALGAVSHLPHGLCMNVFLPYVLKYNLTHDAERLGRLLLPLAGADVYATTPPSERAKTLVEHIHAMRQEIYIRTGLPRTLKETGQVSQEQLPHIIEKAMDDGSIIYNHREADRSALLQILQEAWEG